MPKSDVITPVLLASVDILSETKSRAEDRVKLAHSLLDDEEITSTDLRRLEVLYSDARAGVNAGLDRLLVELETGGFQAAPETYEIVANRAAEQILSFLEASDALILGEDRSSVAEAGVDAAKSVASALVDVWKTLRGEKAEKKTSLIRRLESLKWAQFDDLKSATG